MGAAGTGDGFALGGSVTVNLIDNDVDAHISNSTVSAPEGSVDLQAFESAVMAVLAGGIAVSVDGVAVGAAIAYNYIGGTFDPANPEATTTTDTTTIHGVSATITSSTVTAGKNVSVVASFGSPAQLPGSNDSLDFGYTSVPVPVDLDSMLVSVAVGGAGASDFALGGSVNLNFVRENVTASVAKGSVTAGGNVTVSAGDSSTIDSGAGALAIAVGGAAVGAAISTNDIGNSVLANITGATVSGAQVLVGTTENANIVNVTAAGSGAEYFALGASLSLNLIHNTVQAGIASGAQISGSKLSLVAVTSSDTSTIDAGSGAGSFGGYVSAGVAAAVNDISNTTAATIGGTSTSVTTPAGDVVVQAESTPTIVTAAAGIAVSGNPDIAAASIAGSSAVDVMENDVNAEINAATVTANGNVLVLAQTQATLDTGAGVIGDSTGVGVGGSVVTNYLANITTAQIDNGADVTAEGNGNAIGVDEWAHNAAGTESTQSIHGLAVIASTDETIVNVALNVAAGLAGLGRNFELDEFKDTTTADISGSFINSAAEIGQDVIVRAHDAINATSADGTVTSGGGAFGAAIDAEIYSSATAAAIAGSTVYADGFVEVSALTRESVTSVSAGVAVAGVGFAGGASGVNVGGSTTASISTGSAVFATGNLTVRADDGINLHLGDGVLSSGAGAGAGGAIAVALIGHTTSATIDSSTTDSSGTTLVEADEAETLLDLAVAAGLGGIVAVAGAIGVVSLAANVTAAITISSVNQDKQYQTATQNVTVKATGNASVTDGVGSLAGAGGVGVGAGVDVITIKDAIAAYIGSNSDVNAGGNIDVEADGNKTFSSNVFSFAVAGAASLNGTVTVVGIGGGLDSTGASDLQDIAGTVNSNDSLAGGVPGLNPNIATNQTVQTMTKSSAEGITSALSTDQTPHDTEAYVGQDVTLTAGGNVSVIANETLHPSTALAGQGTSAEVLSVGAAVADITINSAVQAFVQNGTTIAAGGDVTVAANFTDNVTAKSFAGTIGWNAALGVQVSVITDNAAELATLGNGYVTQANSLSVDATANRTLDAQAAGGAVANVAAGAAVALATASGSTMATLGGQIGQTPGQSVGGGFRFVQLHRQGANLDLGGRRWHRQFHSQQVRGRDRSGRELSRERQHQHRLERCRGRHVPRGSVRDARALGVDVAAVGVGVVDSTANVAGSTSSGLGNTVTIVAPSLVVKADRSQDSSNDPTAQSSATAGVGGVLAGVNATVSTASSGGSVTATTGSGSTIQAALPFYGTLTSGSRTITDISSTAGLVVGQLVAGTAIPEGTTITSIVASTPTTPGSVTLSAPVTTGGTGHMLIASGDLGDIAIEATNSSLQNASATGVAGGLLALGLDFAAANSTVSTQAQLGADMITDITGTIAVSAAGTDDNLASSTAGSGGAVAGDASVTNTTDDSTTSATVDGGFLTGTIVLVGANNNSIYTTDANSVNAASAGFSGAAATNTDNTEASTTISDNTAIMASFAVDITAQNTFTETVPLFADSVSAGSGGVVNGTAAVSSSTLIGNADVTIGSDVLISVQTITPPSTGTSGIFVTASSLLNTNDQVKLSAGGVFEGAGTNSSLSATLTNSVKTSSSKAEPDTFTTNENIGIGTYTTADATTTSEASASGGYAGDSATAETDVTSNQTVTLGQYTDLAATQNINISAGDGTIPGTTTATTMAGFSNAESYTRALIAVPAAHATTTLTSNATLTVSTGDQIESGEDLTLAADHGTPEATAQGIGHGYELGFIPVTDGKSSPSTKTSSNVTINGTVVAGTTHELDITIPNDNSVGNGNGDSQDLSVNGGKAVAAGSPSAPTTVSTPSTVAFTASYDPNFNPNTTIATAAADGDLPDVGEASALEDATYNGEVGAMVLGPLFAAGGDVTVNAGTLNGSGTIAAYGGPSITITNDSPDYLVLSSINIPNEPGGHVIYTGTQTSAPSSLNVTESGAGIRPIVTIQEQYDKSVPTGSSNGPSVFATATLNSDGSVSLDSSGSINNVGGQVAITVADGSFIQAGGINANQVNITTANGILALTNPSGLSGNAGTPASTVDQLMYWPGGFNPYAPGGSSPSDLASVYVAYVANAMYNSSGEYTTDQAFSAALLGYAGQIPDSDAPGYENDFQFPTSLAQKSPARA